MEVNLHTFVNLALPAGDQSLPHTDRFISGKEHPASTGQDAGWATQTTDFCQVHSDPSLIILVKITIILKVNFCCLPLGFIFRKSWVPLLDWGPATSYCFFPHHSKFKWLFSILDMLLNAIQHMQLKIIIQYTKKDEWMESINKKYTNPGDSCSVTVSVS
jgi:hypothetical protein